MRTYYGTYPCNYLTFKLLICNCERKTFVSAKNKKDAKKAAAKAALLGLYGLSYPEDTSKQAMEIE